MLSVPFQIQDKLDAIALNIQGIEGILEGQIIEAINDSVDLCFNLSQGLTHIPSEIGSDWFLKDRPDQF